MPTRVIAYKLDRLESGLRVRDSTGYDEVCKNLEAVFDALLEPYDDPNWKVIRVVWDIAQEFSVALALMGRHACEQLAETHRFEIGEGRNKVQVFYVEDKLFSLRRRGYTASWFGVSQFYGDGLPAPVSVDEVQERGAAVLDAFHKVGVFPDRLTSAIGAFTPYLAHWSLPSAKDLPREASLMAYKASGKQWVECHKLGFWEDAQDLDIAAAYPRQMMKLADLRNGHWFSTEREPPDSAYYGYFDCQVKIYDTQVTPILYRVSQLHDTEQTLVAPVGEFPETLTLGEINDIRQNKRGEVKIVQGVYWKDDKLVFPMENVIARLLKKRDEMKQNKIPNSGLAEQILKRLCAGIYGKLGEIHDDGKLGPKHCSPWFCETSVGTRLTVGQFIREHDISPIHVSTDGVIPSGPVQLTDKDRAMGWKETYHGPTLVISSGNLLFGNHKPHGLTLNEVIALIQSDPGGCHWTKQIRRRVTLKEALQRGFHLLGQQQDTVTTVSLLGGQKRVFPRMPHNGRSLLRYQYRSKPYRFNIGNGSV